MTASPDLPFPSLAGRQATPRADGEASRQRLMQAGLRLFAQQGFARTSIRELALAAEVNVAAISYYFGDKAGLYRAVFFNPGGNPADDVARFADPALPLEEAMAGFYQAFLDPLCMGEDGRLSVKLRMHEMLEPTGLWTEEIRQGIQPMHDALVALLCRHLGLAAPDDDTHRLAVCLTALAVHLHVGRDVTDVVAPRLNQAAGAVRQWGDFLTLQAVAMVQAERVRRATPRLPADRLTTAQAKPARPSSQPHSFPTARTT